MVFNFLPILIKFFFVPYKIFFIFGVPTYFFMTFNVSRV